ncbi:hypothetical protein D3C81_1646950 [compost metagenome]
MKEGHPLGDNFILLLSEIRKCEILSGVLKGTKHCIQGFAREENTQFLKTYNFLGDELPNLQLPHHLLVKNIKGLLLRNNNPYVGCWITRIPIVDIQRWYQPMFSQFFSNQNKAVFGKSHIPPDFMPHFNA